MPRHFDLAPLKLLLAELGLPLNISKIAKVSFHVAGTNGKGSICSYLSSILKCSGMKVGTFTTPHLVEPRDSIKINGKSISEEEYTNSMSTINALKETMGINVSPFEVLTASALYLFNKNDVDACVIEVGRGGLYDATNVIEGVTAAVISKISIDHTMYLGDCLTEIVEHKAGIVKPETRFCIVDDLNTSECIDVIKKHANSSNVPVIVSNAILEPNSPRSLRLEMNGKTSYFSLPPNLPLHGSFQISNIGCAVAAIAHAGAIDVLPPNLVDLYVLEGIAKTRHPGRFSIYSAQEDLHLEGNNIVVVDGCHNQDAAISARKAIEEHFSGRSIVYVLALSNEKDEKDLLESLVSRDGNIEQKLYAVTFSPVDTMPWVSHKDPSVLYKSASELVESTNLNLSLGHDSYRLLSCDMLRNIIKSHPDSIIFICGSLYLCSDFYRLFPWLV